MSKRAWAMVLGLSLLPFACRKTEQQAASPPPAPPSAPTASAPVTGGTDAGPPARHSTFSELVGRCVVAEGYIGGGAKTGPGLTGGSWFIGLVLEADAGWGESMPGGARVRVRGTVAVRADRPVFIPKKGEPIMQGIPMPEGTDLEEARRRHVIERAVVTLLRKPAEVQAALAADVGKDVSLTGVVWSVNNHYWFNHDGIELHVEGEESFPEWTSLHGKPVLLRGRLGRRPMPRIDQIVLQPKPDLADAFVLGLREIAPHPDTSIAPCAD